MSPPSHNYPIDLHLLTISRGIAEENFFISGADLRRSFSIRIFHLKIHEVFRCAPTSNIGLIYGAVEQKTKQERHQLEKMAQDTGEIASFGAIRNIKIV